MLQRPAKILSPHQFFLHYKLLFQYHSVTQVTTLTLLTFHMHPQVATHCSVTNHVSTPLNAAPTITNAHLSKVFGAKCFYILQHKKKILQPFQFSAASNLFKFSTCRKKKNLSTKSKTKRIHPRPYTTGKTVFPNFFVEPLP